MFTSDTRSLVLSPVANFPATFEEVQRVLGAVTRS